MGKLLRLLSLRRNPHSVSRFRLGSIWLPLTILLVTALLPKPVMDCKATYRGAECGSKCTHRQRSQSLYLKSYLEMSEEIQAIAWDRE